MANVFLEALTRPQRSKKLVAKVAETLDRKKTRKLVAEVAKTLDRWVWIV
jgi:hypothetical protein